MAFQIVASLIQYEFSQSYNYVTETIEILNFNLGT